MDTIIAKHADTLAACPIVEVDEHEYLAGDYSDCCYDEDEKIAKDTFIEMLKHCQVLKCYEYYDGLQMTLDGSLVLWAGDGGDLGSFQEFFVDILPFLTIHTFSWKSRFQSESDYSSFDKAPETLETVTFDYLPHTLDIDPQFFQGVSTVNITSQPEIDEISEWKKLERFVRKTGVEMDFQDGIAVAEDVLAKMEKENKEFVDKYRDQFDLY